MAATARTAAYLLNLLRSGQPAATITAQMVDDFVASVPGMVPAFNSRNFGAVGTNTSTPLSSLATFSGVTTPALLAAWTDPSGGTPYFWAATAAYGLVFTKNTSASTGSGTVLPFNNVCGDLANPMKFIVAGMTVTGTNIAANTVVNSFTITSGTPNLIDGPLAGTITLNNAITGTVGNGATLTFSYSSSMMQALQVDWLGIQAAEAACGVASWGGHHHTPAGSYIMNRPILRADTPSGQNNSFQSNWTGDGMLNTKLVWGTSLGAGVWAITPYDRTNIGVQAVSFISDMWIQGPGNNLTMGVAGNQMQGLGIGRVGFVARVASQGWWAGCSIVGDHQQFDKCYFQNNFINLFFGPLAGQDNGDQVVRDCFLDGSTWASVGVAGTGKITYALFERCHGGFGPYGMYKFSGSDLNFMIATRTIRVSFEACGNGALYDENTGGQVYGCDLDMDWNLDNSNFYEITSRTTFAMAYLGNVDTTVFGGTAQNNYTGNYNRGTRPCTKAIVVANQALNNCHFKNALALVQAGTTSFPAVWSGNSITASVRWSYGMGSLQGCFRPTNNSTVTANTFVAQANYGFCRTPSSGTYGIIGLAIYGSTGADSSALLAVMDGGMWQVNKHANTDVITGGTMLQIFSTSDGSVVAFNAGARTFNVGRVYQDTSSGQTQLNIEIDLKGP